MSTIHTYQHETPMGDNLETTVELETGSDGQPLLRLIQENNWRLDEPDEIIIDVRMMKAIMKRVEELVVETYE